MKRVFLKSLKNPTTKKILGSIWVFPAIIILVIIILSSMKISGSSIGIYSQTLYGENYEDPDLLFGHPRTIRSDEWIFNTQMTIAQSEENFPRINQNINSGRDMSVNTDVPYKDWSVILKPQNLAFFVLPLEVAFAFKWWFLLGALIISVYFFVLHFFPKKRLLASILALGFSLSPFIMWWYQTATLATLFYGFFIILASLKIIDKKTVSKKEFALYTIILTYLISSFALVLYPPFQISISIVVFVFILGYFLNTSKKLNYNKSKRLVILISPLVLALLVILLFIKTRQDAVHILQNTLYPGKRTVDSGGFDLFKIFTTHLQPQLQRSGRAVNYFTNQSEASSFLLLLPLLIMPGILICYKQIKKRSKDYLFISLQLLSILFFVNLFVPGLNSFFRLFALDRVPHERLLIGLGFLGFLYLIYLMKILSKDKSLLKRKQAVLFSIISFILLLAGSLHVKDMYPKFISNVFAILLLTTVLSLIIFFILNKNYYRSAALFLIFSLFSVGYINPLYRGLGPIYNDRLLSSKIDQLSADTNASWGVVDDILFENLPLIHGKEELTGIQPYPDISLWRNIGGDQYDPIYNRYAHVILTDNKDMKEDIKLIQSDSFQIKLQCSKFIIENIDLLISLHNLEYSCFEKIDQIKYPAREFNFYRVVK